MPVVEILSTAPESRADRVAELRQELSCRDMAGLLECISECELTIADIQSQIERDVLDRTRGEIWLYRARAAIRYWNHRRTVAIDLRKGIQREENRIDREIKLAREKRIADQKAQDILNREAKAARQNASLQRGVLPAKVVRNTFFTTAAHTLLDPELIDRIWAHAKTLDVEAAGWTKDES